MLHYTDDPLRDFERNEEEKEKWLASRPVCDACGEHIQEEIAFLHEGSLLCTDCWDEVVNDQYLVRLED